MKQNYLVSSNLITHTFNNIEYSYIDLTNLVIKKKIQRILPYYENVLEKIKINDDTKIEAISKDYYSNSIDFWDFIVIINEMESLMELPANSDIVEQRTQDRYNKFLKHKLNYNEEQLRAKYQEIKDKEIQKNEKYRYIKFVPVNLLTQFLSDAGVEV